MHKLFFALTFADYIYCSYHNLPPITFFSHNSPIEYSSNQVLSDSSDCLLNTVWLSSLFTTMISSAENSLTRFTDWVAMIICDCTEAFFIIPPNFAIPKG